MGMFDSFIPSEAIICPRCGEKIENSDRDLPYKCVLQSKDFECMLHSFKQSEPLETKTNHINVFIKDGWLEAHTVCDKCDSYVQFKIIVQNGIWVRTEPYENGPDTSIPNRV